MGFWQSVREVINGRLEEPAAPVQPRITVRYETSRSSKPADYDSPYLPSDRWDELLVPGLEDFPLGLNFQRGFLVERTTGKFVNVANKHLRGLGVWSCRLKGNYYYPGEVWAGRKVTLVREPDNPHDKNAIAIFNDRGEQVGHWNKGMAASLAKVLDSGQPIEAVALDHEPPKIVAASPEVMALLLSE